MGTEILGKAACKDHHCAQGETHPPGQKALSHMNMITMRTAGQPCLEPLFMANRLPRPSYFIDLMRIDGQSNILRFSRADSDELWKSCLHPPSSALSIREIHIESHTIGIEETTSFNMCSLRPSATRSSAIWIEPATHDLRSTRITKAGETTRGTQTVQERHFRIPSLHQFPNFKTRGM